MTAVYSVNQIRRAEQPLLDAQIEPDELMKRAAHAVAEAARVMLAEPVPVPELLTGRRVLILAGSGGNSGDALYAGAELSRAGFGVDAYVLGDAPWESALAEFRRSGGNLLDEPLSSLLWRMGESYRLIVDGIVGLGAVGALREPAAWLIREANAVRIPVLAVDIPSGIDPDTGQVFPGPVATLEMDDALSSEEDADLPGHVTATVTVTFGGLRRAHALSVHCGEVVVADIALPSSALTPDRMSLADELRNLSHRDALENGDWMVQFTRAVSDTIPKSGAPVFEWAPFSDDSAEVFSAHGQPPRPLQGPAFFAELEPGADDSKYSGGVVGICAGSDKYPGAAILATKAAVRSTSSMVRYVGSCAAQVVQAVPEVIAHSELSDDVRVDAWVVGPGRGTDDEAAEELRILLERDEPMVVDADAVTLLARHASLRDLLAERAVRGAETVLTPHLGEFERLVEGMGDEAAHFPDAHGDPLGAVEHMCVALRCMVLLKGRRSVMGLADYRNAVAEERARAAAEVFELDAGTDSDVAVDEADLEKVTRDRIRAHIENMGHDVLGLARIIDTSTSWAATPGSGDVLSGIIGAWAARAGVWNVAMSTVIHAQATELSARTEFGYAPTSASLIIDAIRPATALVVSTRDA
ncbi:NAD(P)H-hydrate dehydratase [Corynebacterium sp. H113]|uniref:NAD(P)H-hydrate dehydratase n=1 Tax=Corynebacterium sp. H113 TaxID=3133419 RepID=UPI0030A9661E